MDVGESEPLLDPHPASADLEVEALAGLRADPKTLPCKLFYDERGSELFEAICQQPEYYLTRVETAILRESVEEIAAELGPQVQLIEPGSGAGTKTRLLLDALEDPVSYVPIDISKEHLRGVAASIRADYPALQVQAVCADFQQTIPVPAPERPARRRVVFFPGSTIGNFAPEEARAFLGRMADMAGPGGGILIGFDRSKDAALLEAAYDDAKGITAAFNLNVLRRLNLDVGTDFELEQFRHAARWNDEFQRIEMHLVSQVEQIVHVGGQAVPFAAGESIRTECCHKYGPEGVAPLADGFAWVRTWTDAQERFGVQFLATRLATRPLD